LRLVLLLVLQPFLPLLQMLLPPRALLQAPKL
jgi:hypothetical protein